MYTRSELGHIVSVINVFRPKTENALLGHFRLKIFGGRIFGASPIGLGIENRVSIGTETNFSFFPESFKS